MRYTERFEMKMSKKMLADLSHMAHRHHEDSVSSCVRKILKEAIKNYKLKYKIRRR